MASRSVIMKITLLTMMLIGMLAFTASAAMTCLGENGKPVDWWFIYKMPGGFQFAYKDATDSSAVPLTISPALLNRTETGALGATLHQIYQAKQSPSIASLLWNDEHPDSLKGGDDASNLEADASPNFSADDNAKLRGPFPGGGGHTKGVVALDANGGYYLVHSVPKFPDLRFTTFTWNASITYGQTFLCVSLDRPTASQLGSHLQWINPDLFDVHLPPTISSLYPSFAALVSGARAKGSHTFKFNSIGGTAFTAFGKSNTWGGDLYEELVEPGLNVGFDWQTWRRGLELPSVCNPPAPYNSSNILTTSVGSYTFSYTRDHAKWGVSQPSVPAMLDRMNATERARAVAAGAYVCVGDINRMTSQRNRGGGTVCSVQFALHRALSDTIRQREPCKK